ncbi:hypothetical protein [Olivibacter sitiensis]|uniref:hypothetical protein n=1 Tax=Olivibacter sitiensis TaxID=376470 RepID=UPI000423B46C|nr:hypothetical protein [Olivibacter sitiensis]
MALNKEPIAFRQKRDFGQIISDSFAFISQQPKSLFSTVLVLAGIFMLGSWASNSIYQIQAIQIYGSMGNGSNVNALLFGIPYFLYLFFTMLTVSCVTLATLSYLKAYDDNPGHQVTIQHVWYIFKGLFLKYLLATIAFSILIFIGIFLCLIPGIYLFPILTLAYPIMVFENTGIGSAFDRGRTLIREKWWKTFGTLLLATLVTSMCTYIFMLPSMFITIFSVFFKGQGWLANGLTVVASLIASFGQLTYVFMSIASTLCYFSLREEKESVGLMDRIERFGSDEDSRDGDLPKEEY